MSDVEVTTTTKAPAGAQAPAEGKAKVSKPDAHVLTTTNASSYEVAPAATKDMVWQADGETIAYRASASTVELRDDAGALIGHMFALSYVVLEDGEPQKDRPVTFCYNGGPGSSSIPVNFGGIGPKRVPTDGERHVQATGAEDNPYTLLRKSDLVFLDAPTTGWSSLAEGVDPKRFLGIDGDADAFARCIQRWLTDNKRWSSPVYLFGESYGTIRCAVLSAKLGAQGVQLAGIVMLSAIFDWVQVLPGQDTYYLGMMPTLAAAAQYFGKAGAGVDVDTWFDQAQSFATATLAPALLAGDRLPKEQERAVAQELAEYLGLPVGFVLQRHLRVSLEDFRGRILEDEGKVCGRLDMRFVSDAYHPAQQNSNYLEEEDPADDAFEGAWSKAFHTWVVEELGYTNPVRYKTNNFAYVGSVWKWDHAAAGTGWPVGASNVTFDLAHALRRSPTTKLAILGGRYDAATPWWNVEHDMAQQFFSADAKKNIEWHRYGCGHMAYTDVPTLKAMYQDLAAFYDKEPVATI